MIKFNNCVVVDKKIPALRIALTPKCNLSCEYCPPRGENFLFSRGGLSSQKLLKILNIFYEIGFRQFGFTGGEPLLSEKLYPVIKGCLKLKNIYLKLYTNGLLLKEKMDIVNKFDLVKLSLDAIGRKKYAQITGRDKLEDVFEGIRLAKKNKIKIRFNTVLMQNNYDGILNLINYCCEQGFDLKILDLNCFATPGYSVWKSLYKSPQGLMHYLETMGLEKKTVFTTGNYGIPMPEYKLGKIHIRIKDTSGHAVYSPVCQDCKYFLCQEGLYHLTLTHDGRLKMCRHRPDISVGLNHNNSCSKIEKGIEAFLKEHYFPAHRQYLKKQVFLGCFGQKKSH